MAHSPQGPGWWQASNGGWYPPEDHPGQPLQAPQPQIPQPQAPQPQAPQPGDQQPSYQQPGPPQQAYGPPAYGAPAYGQPPAPSPAGPTPTPKSNTGKLIALVSALIVIALIAGAVVVFSGDDRGSSAASQDPDVIVGRSTDDTGTAGGRAGTKPDKSMKEEAPKVDTGIIDASDGPENDVVATAIVDIEEFWTEEFPATFGSEYQPVEGGFYSWSPDEDLPPCVDTPDNISGNAFYCGDADVVAWDDTDLIPHLYETFGDLSVAIVFAHEWGHAIQARAGEFGATVTLEQQADCFAGAWVQHVADGGSDYFTVSGPALDQALAGFIEIADTPGTSALDPNAHGSAFDRINSFKEGLDEGSAACAEYSDETVAPRLVELEFESQEDFDRNGNAPYEDILDYATADLEDYWSTVAPQFDATWTPLSEAIPFDGTRNDTPDCGDADTSGFSLFYCVDSNFIAYDDVGLFPDIYDSLGDFAVAALYGSQYSLAAQDQFGISPDEPRKQNLMADCMTGSWAASVFLRDRQTAELILSPGDFDEAVKVLLALGSKEEDGGTQGTGFERVSAFRDGVVNGIGACTE